MCVSLKVCGKVCVFVSLCAFYLLTPRTSIPVRRTSRLSSQRDTERGQCEQRSFVRNECGHEKFGNGMVWETTPKLLFKKPRWLETIYSQRKGLWGRPFVRHLCYDSQLLRTTADPVSVWKTRPQNALWMINVFRFSFTVSEVLGSSCGYISHIAFIIAPSPTICPAEVLLSKAVNNRTAYSVVDWL